MRDASGIDPQKFLARLKSRFADSTASLLEQLSMTEIYAEGLEEENAALRERLNVLEADSNTLESRPVA